MVEVEPKPNAFGAVGAFAGIAEGEGAEAGAEGLGALPAKAPNPPLPAEVEACPNPPNALPAAGAEGVWPNADAVDVGVPNADAAGLAACPNADWPKPDPGAGAVVDEPNADGAVVVVVPNADGAVDPPAPKGDEGVLVLGVVPNAEGFAV